MSTWKKKKYRDLAIAAVKKHGGPLLTANPRDGAAYGLANNTDRILFFAELLGTLARIESNQNPERKYKENFKDSRGNRVISRGLLQISIESANGYGAGLKKEEELHDPETNLKAGVLIMSRWVLRDKLISTTRKPWRGMARYWSPFRNSSKRSQIKSATKAEFSQAHAVAGRSMRNDDRGEDVVLLQEALAGAGCDPGPADGVFRKRTEAAVRKFQKKKGLKVDGIAGPVTQGALSIAPSDVLIRYSTICPPFRPKFTKSEIKELVSGLGFKKAPILIIGVRGHYRDNMGDVGKNDRKLYDDAVVTVQENGTVHTFNGNTDPNGRKPGHGTGSSKGMATLTEGLWSGVYKRRKHSGQYDALCQDGGPVTVRRDADSKVPKKDIVVVDGEKFYLHTGMFGINIHRGSTRSTSSAGCQTIYPPQWLEFQKLVYKAMKAGKMSTVPYGVVRI